ncbi:MAG: hypothetical protein K2J20_06295, partial [Bacilli bacterium]|nr:hypothetical protein [Bacilli bacterium]
MKPSTFDVPAYRFALLKFDEEYTGDMTDFESYDNWARKKINDDKVDFIPWENFDGLTIKEVTQLLGQMHPNLFFVGYTICQSRYGMQ